MVLGDSRDLTESSGGRTSYRELRGLPKEVGGTSSDARFVIPSDLFPTSSVCALTAVKVRGMLDMSTVKPGTVTIPSSTWLTGLKTPTY